MNKKSKLLNILIMLVYLILSCIVCFLFSMYIFLNNYSNVTNRILSILLLIGLFIGIFQLIFNKFKFKYMHGRIWGVVVILSCMPIFSMMQFNDINKKITMIYEDDIEKINTTKQEYFSPNFDKASIETMYEFKMFEDTIVNFNHENFNNITCYYSNEDGKKSSNIIANTIIKNKDAINNIFNLSINTESEVIILNNLNLISKVTPGAVAYVEPKTNKIYILDYNSYKVGTGDDLLDYEKTIIHEYSHVLTINLAKTYNVNIDYLPPWFYEGIATYIENTILGDELPLITEDHGSLRENKNFISNISSIFYKDSAILINYLINTYGENIIIDIMSDLKNSEDIYLSLEKITGITFEDIEKEIYK